MIKLLSSLPVAMLATLLVAPLTSFAQTAPLRTYAISGTENRHEFVSNIGWVDSTKTFNGTLDLVSTTEARLTRNYSDGTAVVCSLILQWTVDLNVPIQGGQAAEVPDPTDPMIKRTSYNLGLQFDGLRYTASANYLTRAWLSVIPGIYDWFNVASGNFSGCVISPLGSYSISGTESDGKATSTYSGTFTLLSLTTARLTKTFADGSAATVNLGLGTPVDPAVGTQTILATQIESQPNQATTYALQFDLPANGARYSVNAGYVLTQAKGRTSRTLLTGGFGGQQL